MDKTFNLGLPYIAPAQAQKHVTHNEAIRALDALIQISVADRDVSVPPVSPAEGERYLIASEATGVWSGHSGSLAAYQDGAWHIYAPRHGWLVWVRDEAVLLVRDGDQWSGIGSGGTTARLGINTSPDTNNRLSVKSNSVLFSHDDVTPGTGSSRVVVNKRHETDSASVLFQDSWSGKAEIGLTGNNSLNMRISSDGESFDDVMVLNRTQISCKQPLKLNYYNFSNLPSPVFSRRGSLVMSGRNSAARPPVIAYCDGSFWRSLTDNSVVT